MFLNIFNVLFLAQLSILYISLIFGDLFIAYFLKSLSLKTLFRQEYIELNGIFFF